MSPQGHLPIILDIGGVDGGKHILSPKPPDGMSEIIEFPRLEVSDRRELSSYEGTSDHI